MTVRTPCTDRGTDASASEQDRAGHRRRHPVGPARRSPAVHGPGDRARVDPDQGGADRSGPRAARRRQPDWENQLVDRLWTYSLDAVWTGVPAERRRRWPTTCARRHGVELAGVGALGVSAMMHGYLAFDADGALLTPFRTWRNTNTGRAAERLSAEFGCNIPHRWSVAHLYQAILDGEEHVGRLDHLTTLAGYVHRQLTGEQVLGIGDASGMFPIDARHRRLRRRRCWPGSTSWPPRPGPS